MQCQNNLKQIGLALHNYQTTTGVFPPAEIYPVPTTGNLSIHVALMPYVEQGSLADAYQAALAANSSTASNSGAAQALIPLYVCPSDNNVQAVADGTDASGNPVVKFPITYGFNYGTWFLYDWSANRGGDGAFAINAPQSPAGFPDGMSSTLAAAEVKAQLLVGGAKALVGYYRNSHIPNTANAPAPVDPVAFAAGYCSGGSSNNNLHLNYYSALVQQAGFTTAFPPNTALPYTYADGVTYDIDFVSNAESATATGYTYAAVTSRSFHSGGVNVVLMDGSVRFVRNSIPAATWQASAPAPAAKWSATIDFAAFPHEHALSLPHLDPGRVPRHHVRRQLIAGLKPIQMGGQHFQKRSAGPCRLLFLITAMFVRRQHPFPRQRHQPRFGVQVCDGPADLFGHRPFALGKQVGDLLLAGRTIAGPRQDRLERRQRGHDVLGRPAGRRHHATDGVQVLSDHRQRLAVQPAVHLPQQQQLRPLFQCELNGRFRVDALECDLHFDRRPKPIVGAQIGRADQPFEPIIDLDQAGPCPNQVGVVIEQLPPQRAWIGRQPKSLLGHLVAFFDRPGEFVVGKLQQPDLSLQLGRCEIERQGLTGGAVAVVECGVIEDAAAEFPGAGVCAANSLHLPGGG